ncbi:MAG: hypothetical protein AB1454_03675 [Candidatus Auribacterota bacterium]
MKSEITHNYIHVCDNVIRDSQTGALSFINIRRHFVVESFPTVLRNFFVTAGLTFKSDKKVKQTHLYAQLKLISPDNKIQLDLKQSVPLEHRDKRLPNVDCIFRIERLVCNDPGVYRIQLIDFPNELLLAELDVNIQFPPLPVIDHKSPAEIEALLQQPDIIKKVESSVQCPRCKHERKFTLQLEKDLFKRLEQETALPDDLVYLCEKCGEWRIHLGKMLVFMYNKLGQKITPNQ